MKIKIKTRLKPGLEIISRRGQATSGAMAEDAGIWEVVDELRSRPAPGNDQGGGSY